MTKLLWARHVACKGELVNMYRVLVWKETHGRPGGRWETTLILILNNLILCIKKLFNWLRDLDFVAEDKDK